MAAHTQAWRERGECPREENRMGRGGLEPHARRMSGCVCVEVKGILPSSPVLLQ